MTRPFPWKCRECGKRTLKPVVVDYSTEMEHDGRLYSFTVPNLEILECEACHSRVLPKAALEAVVDKLRAEAGLLKPAEILEKRKRLGLTQEQLANYLRVAKETVSRWETGRQIQQLAMNDFMEAFFAVPALRMYLKRRRGLEQAVEPADKLAAQSSLGTTKAAAASTSPLGGLPYADIVFSPYSFTSDNTEGSQFPTAMPIATAGSQ